MSKAGDRRTLRCPRCDKAVEVSKITKSTLCSGCHRTMRTEDEVVVLLQRDARRHLRVLAHVRAKLDESLLVGTEGVNAHELGAPIFERELHRETFDIVVVQSVTHACMRLELGPRRHDG